jgi:hypothetical protein
MRKKERKERRMGGEGDTLRIKEALVVVYYSPYHLYPKLHKHIHSLPSSHPPFLLRHRDEME